MKLHLCVYLYHVIVMVIRHVTITSYIMIKPYTRYLNYSALSHERNLVMFTSLWVWYNSYRCLSHFFAHHLQVVSIELS